MRDCSVSQSTCHQNYRRLVFLFVLVWLVASPPFLFESFQVKAQTDLETMVANLKSPDVLVRRKAAKELGERRFREASGPLAEAARTDSDAEVRSAAVESVGRIKDFEAIPAVIEVLKDTAPPVRRSAIRALVSYYIESEIGFVFAERKGWNTLNPFLDTDGSTIVEPYTQVDSRMLEALAGVMRNDGDLSLRRAGVRALGVLRSNSQVPALAAALQSDPDLRVDIFRVFIKLGDKENGTYAIPYFNDENREVRAQAIFTAGILRTTKAVERLTAVYNLGEDKRGFKGSINDFFRQIPERQFGTLQALAQIGDPSSRDIFVKNLTSGDTNRRCLANEGLARMNDASFLEPISRNRLKESNEEVKLSQAFALYRLGRPEYLDYIVSKLEAITLGDQAEAYLIDVLKPSDLHPYLHQATVGAGVKLLKALGKIGTPESIPAIEPLLRDANPRIANTANLAIQRIKMREKFQKGELPTKPPEGSDSPTRPRRTKNGEGQQ